jgi:HCOMODA/2-hydroxy-3-carboxy-muconic semialdehyde decarboxylase
MSTQEDKDLLAEATRVAAAHGLIGMFGHLSYYPEHAGDRYLLSPGAGFQKQTCTGGDVYDVAFDDKWVQGLPLEIYMHSEVHRMHPEVGALVHSHSPALTQLSTLAQVPGDAMLLHASFWPDEVPVFEDTHLVVERHDAARLIEQLGDSPLILLRWHGAVIVGSTLEEAVFRSIQAEANAQVLLTAMATGRPYIPLPGGIERHKTAEAVITPRMLGLHRNYQAAQLSSPAPTSSQES